MPCCGVLHQCSPWCRRLHVGFCSDQSLPRITRGRLLLCCQHSCHSVATYYQLVAYRWHLSVVVGLSVVVLSKRTAQCVADWWAGRSILSCCVGGGVVKILSRSTGWLGNCHVACIPVGCVLIAQCDKLVKDWRHSCGALLNLYLTAVVHVVCHQWDYVRSSYGPAKLRSLQPCTFPHNACTAGDCSSTSINSQNC